MVYFSSKVMITSTDELKNLDVISYNYHSKFTFDDYTSVR